MGRPKEIKGFMNNEACGFQHFLSEDLTMSWLLIILSPVTYRSQGSVPR